MDVHSSNVRRRRYIEILNGKYDGWTLDSNSNDPIEREIVSCLALSPNIEVVTRLESEGEQYLQIRHRLE